MSVAIGAVGALFVLSDQMTIGALIAFNMMGLRLAQPLIQASTLKGPVVARTAFPAPR